MAETPNPTSPTGQPAAPDSGATGHGAAHVALCVASAGLIVTAAILATLDLYVLSLCPLFLGSMYLGVVTNVWGERP